jgi:type III restriction enzyme
MSQFNEVPEPIICDAYAEPSAHWVIERGKPPVKAPRRREACYYYRPPGRSTGASQANEVGTRFALDLVNDVRERVKAWRQAGTPALHAAVEELGPDRSGA